MTSHGLISCYSTRKFIEARAVPARQKILPRAREGADTPPAHAVAAEPPIQCTVRQIAKERSAGCSCGTDDEDLLVGGDEYRGGAAIPPIDEAEHSPAVSPKLRSRRPSRLKRAVAQ